MHNLVIIFVRFSLDTKNVPVINSISIDFIFPEHKMLETQRTYKIYETHKVFSGCQFFFPFLGE